MAEAGFRGRLLWFGGAGRFQVAPKVKGYLKKEQPEIVWAAVRAFQAA